MNVTICIPTYNQSAFLFQSVSSACNQLHICHVHVSDDASDDQTEEVIASLLEKYPNIEYTRQVKNLGVGGNPRWLFQRVKTPYVAKLDSDDLLDSNYISELCSLLDRYPEAGYAHASVQEIDAMGRNLRVRRLSRRSGYQDADTSIKGMVAGYRVAANICLFRLEALRSVDFYKTDMSFAEDWDLAVRLADAGWGNVYSDEVLAKYRVWDDDAGTRQRRKIKELVGIRRVFDESLTPAFRNRGWDENILKSQRIKLALNHASVLVSMPREDEEFNKIVALLTELGDSTRLNIKLKMIMIGFGKIMLFYQHMTLKGKDIMKAIVSYFHSR